MRNKCLRLLLSMFLALAVAVPGVGVFPTVQVEAATAKLNKTNVLLGVGGTYTLKVSGTTATSFTSNKTGVATVSSKGKITAKKKGTAVISVKCKNGKTYKCTVNVVAKAAAKKMYLVSTTEESNDDNSYYSYSNGTSSTTEQYDYDKNGNLIRKEVDSTSYAIRSGVFEYYADGSLKSEEINYYGKIYHYYYDKAGEEVGYDIYEDGQLTESVRTEYGKDYEENNTKPLVVKDKNGKITEKTYYYNKSQYGEILVTLYYNKSGKLTKRTEADEKGKYSLEETYYGDGSIKTSKTKTTDWYDRTSETEINYDEQGEQIYLYEKDSYGERHTTTTIERNTKGLVSKRTATTKTSSEWGESSYTLVQTLKYDAEGRVTEDKTTKSDDNSYICYTYKYDSDGRVVKETIANENYLLGYIWYKDEMYSYNYTIIQEYKYDKNGNVIEHSDSVSADYYTDYASTEKYTYFKDNSIKTLTIYENGEVVQVSTYVPGYDAGEYHNNKEKRMNYKDGKESSGESWEYDDDGNLLSYVVLNRNGNGLKVVTTYSENETRIVEYDANGKKNGREDVTTKRVAADGSYTVEKVSNRNGFFEGKYLVSLEAYDKYGNCIIYYMYSNGDEPIQEHSLPVYKWSGNTLTVEFTYLDPLYKKEYKTDTYTRTYDDQGNVLHDDEADYTYDANGNRMTQTRRGSSYATWTRDEAGRPLYVETKSEASDELLSTVTWTYDEAGRPLTYEDRDYRFSGQGTSKEWTYDKSGNLLSYVEKDNKSGTVLKSITNVWKSLKDICTK